MPLTTLGNRYVIVFLDYCTKWVEAYPLPDQTSETIARVLVDKVSLLTWSTLGTAV